MTEEAFQRQLDANPEDHATRLVFADWLEEQGDPRAAGYRWLGENQKWPQDINDGYFRFHMLCGPSEPCSCRHAAAREWMIPSIRRDEDAFLTRRTRRECEDALCAVIAQQVGVLV